MGGMWVWANSGLFNIAMALNLSVSFTFKEIINLEEEKKPAQTNFQTLKKQNVNHLLITTTSSYMNVSTKWLPRGIQIKLPI